MIRRPPRSTRTDTLFPYTTLFRSYDAFNAITGRVAARVSYDSTPIWQKKFTYSYGVELIATREADYDFAQGDRRYDFYTILGQIGRESCRERECQYF